jgi:tetratricopeptide (TPR) repeat protein
MKLPKAPNSLLNFALACTLFAGLIFSSRPLMAELAGPETPALHALLEGRVEDAQSLLQTTLAQHPSNAAAHLLLCRVFYAQDQADPAIRECELATAADPQSSDSFLWLGRAYGMKARHAGPLAGFSLARKVRASFETAAQLNPSSVAALSDLGEYYVNAPSIVGGGDDKAQALAARILPQFPSPAHRILAMLADSNKDLATAESEYKIAVSTAKGAEAQAGAWIDLGHFYQVHKRYDEAVSAVRSGLAVERAHGPVLVDAASILVDAHREAALAERCLRDYLAGHSRSDAAPTFKVHLQLARLLAARGQSGEADRETATAQALAPAFRGHHSTEGI